MIKLQKLLFTLVALSAPFAVASDHNGSNLLFGGRTSKIQSTDAVGKLPTLGNPRAISTPPQPVSKQAVNAPSDSDKPSQETLRAIKRQRQIAGCQKQAAIFALLNARLIKNFPNEIGIDAGEKVNIVYTLPNIVFGLEFDAEGRLLTNVDVKKIDRTDDLKRSREN